MSDLYLKLVVAIDQIVVTPTTVQSAQDVSVNSAIKDEMREGDLNNILVPGVIELIKIFSQNNIVEQANIGLEIMGLYSAWIDINLVLNNEFINQLYNLITLNCYDLNIRKKACDCLSIIIHKGMVPIDKLKLIEVLNVFQLIQSVQNSEELQESLSKLVNSLGIELVEIYKKCNTNDAELLKEKIYNFIEKTQDYTLTFFSNENEDISTIVYSSLDEMLNIIKLEKKTRGGLKEPQIQFIKAIIPTIVKKIEYAPDHEFEYTTEYEDTNSSDYRKDLCQLFLAVYALDEDTVKTFVTEFISSLFSNNVSWQYTEVCLTVLFLTGEAIQSKYGSITKSEFFMQVLNTLVSNELAQLHHPSVCLIYFDIALRFFNFFTTNTQNISNILTLIVNRGLPNKNAELRSHVWYVFYKFCKAIKQHITSSPLTLFLLDNVKLYLNVSVDTSSISLDSLGQSDGNNDQMFKHQLYLFETYGMLLLLIKDKSIQKEYLQISLTPLLNNLQNIVQLSGTDDLYNVLVLHHVYMAIGSIFRGFADLKDFQELIPVIDYLTTNMLQTLEVYSSFKTIRIASRYAYSMLIQCTNSEKILAYMPRFINCFIQYVDNTELADIYSFLGMLVYKYQIKIYALIDQVYENILSTTFSLLSLCPSGTDETIRLQELRQTYLTFLLTLTANNLKEIITTQNNITKLPIILNTIHYILTSQPRNNQIVKMCFALLTKINELQITINKEALVIMETNSKMVNESFALLKNSSTIENNLLNEIVMFHLTVFKYNNNSFQQLFGSYYLDNNNSSKAFAFELLNNNNTNAYKTILKELSNLK